MILPDELRLNRDNGCAFLVGNGINLYNESYYDWGTFLKKIFPNGQEKIANDFLPLSFDILVTDSEERDYNINKDAIDVLKKMGREDRYSKFIQYAIKKQCPILTTNFDQALIDKGFTEDQKSCLMKDKDGFIPFHKSSVPSKERAYFPLDCYYSDKEISQNDDIKRKFAIWHIHGTIHYQNSLCLGFNNYMKLIEKSKKIFRNKPQTTNFNSNEFTIEDTWLDIFFNCNLIIFGLGLDQCEMDLYWLLSKKYTYNQNVYYIYNENSNDMTDSKRQILESLEVKLVPFQSYEEIYEDYKIFKDDRD